MLLFFNSKQQVDGFEPFGFVVVKKGEFFQKYWMFMTFSGLNAVTDFRLARGADFC